MTTRVYAVREAGTVNIHGLFWAPKTSYLADTIEQMCDLDGLEVAQLFMAGGVWVEGDAKPYPQDGDGIEFVDLDRSKRPVGALCYSDWSEELDEVLSNQAALTWVPATDLRKIIGGIPPVQGSMM